MYLRKIYETLIRAVDGKVYTNVHLFVQGERPGLLVADSLKIRNQEPAISNFLLGRPSPQTPSPLSHATINSCFPRAVRHANGRPGCRQLRRGQGRRAVIELFKRIQCKHEFDVFVQLQFIAAVIRIEPEFGFQRVIFGKFRFIQFLRRKYQCKRVVELRVFRPVLIVILVIFPLSVAEFKFGAVFGSRYAAASATDVPRCAGGRVV